MRIVVLGAVAVLAAGCGAPDGANVFRSQCSGCHTLTGHERGAMGGDLGIPILRESDIASFARQMPTPKPLSRAQARAVAKYVARRERAFHGQTRVRP